MYMIHPGDSVLLPTGAVGLVVRVHEDSGIGHGLLYSVLVGEEVFIFDECDLTLCAGAHNEP